MASMAAESIASVPHSHLQALREQLLDSQPKLSAHERSSTSMPEDHVDSNTADGEQASAVIPESAGARRTPRSSRPHLRPQLSSSKSAPHAEMEAIVHPSPSQDAFRALTRAGSFHGYPGGDTQPMESQVYRDYTESMIQSAMTTPQKKTVVKAKIFPHGAYNTHDTAMTNDKTPHTLREDDTGFVDLRGAWQEQNEVVSTSPCQEDEGSDIDELLASAQTQIQVPELPERLAMPATPAMAGYKRDSDGEILTSDVDTTKKTQTPGFSQIFGVSGPIRPTLSATQLFVQTQAQSSPALDQLRSDPVITRPSPNHHASSPFATTSSPLLTNHGAPMSTAGMPRDRYTSMRESQEQRAKRLRAEYGRPAVGDFSDKEEETSQEKRMRARGVQRTLSDQALHKYSGAKMPQRANSRPGLSRKSVTTIDLVTPATSRKKLGRVEFDSLLSDGENEEDEQELSMNEDDRDNDLLHAEDIDDVYDELGQTVLRSQRDKQTDDLEDKDEAQDGDNPHDDEMHEDEGRRDAARQHPGRDHEPPDTEAQYAVSATQQSAIKDSQSGPLQASIHDIAKQAGQQSSMSSFIPGSQYAGKTSQEQATSRKILRQNTASQRAEIHASDKMPSSPPVAFAQSSTLPDDTAEASEIRRDLLAQFQGREGSTVNDARSDGREIPESEDVAQSNSRPPTSHLTSAAPFLRRDDSNTYPNVPFSTARTHPSASNSLSPMKPMPTADKSTAKALRGQRSGLLAESPRRLAGVRNFADIMGEPAALNRGDSSGESQIDVDAIMGDVMTAEDEAFIEAMSSPVKEDVPKKRRKLTHLTSTNVLADMASPLKSKWHVESESMARAPEIDQTVLGALLGSATGREASRPDEEAVLRNSPNKANQLPVSTPENVEQPKTTQESTRKREQAGARAVSQLLSGREKKSVVRYGGRPSKLAGKGRKASGTPKEEKLKTASTSAAATRAGSQLAQETAEYAGHSAVDTAAAPRINTTTIKVQPAVDELRNRAAGSDAGQVPFSNRILALFKGSYNHFYPATHLSTSLDGKFYKVRFDDTTVTNIDACQVRALDLRIGDHVRVNLKGMRKEVWIVAGFRKLANGEQADLGTDCAGNAWLQVHSKPTARKSMTAATTNKDNDVTDGAHEVMVESIYLTHTMWPAFADRPFMPPTSGPSRLNGGRLATPVTSDAQIPNDTPASRSHRSILPLTKTGNGKQLDRAAHLREESVASSRSRTPIVGRGLFAGMAFAISYVSDEAEKAQIRRHIHNHGGMILNGGFEELFVLSSMDEGAPTPKKATNASGTVSGLMLKPEFADLTFVALIADRHSRRAKYMQALALGLPTLSGRWIEDCLKAVSADDKADAELLPWSRYLLPAGESTYLKGAIRSRTLHPCPAAEATLSETMANRELLLNGDGVLIVASKKNKATWDRRKAYAFLTLALGAGTVKRVNDLYEAKAYLVSSLSNSAETSWRWIYIDGSVEAAHAALFGQSARSATGEKRKRDEQIVKKEKMDRKAMSADGTEGNVKVVNDEFVIQSLILGALVE